MKYPKIGYFTNIIHYPSEKAVITVEEIGNTITRLAIADDGFLITVFQAAHDAEQDLLPEDLEKIKAWAQFVRMLRAVIKRNATNDSEQ